jgi:hypothetical protein
MHSQSRAEGEDGLMEEEAKESRRSKLLPYGLLSSSFHILPQIALENAVWALLFGLSARGVKKNRLGLLGNLAARGVEAGGR